MTKEEIEKLFEEWFDMPLKFDEETNRLLRETAWVAFFNGHVTGRIKGREEEFVLSSYNPKSK